MKGLSISLFLCLLCAQINVAQSPKQYNAAEIQQALEKLNFLGTVLYVAAHPDDENTRLIAYLANEVKANTAYLSMTRGDGGQNLVGPEIRELLGVIRTQELLAARRTDGGQQFFTRANDFGYSKSPEETLTIWNKEEVLADVVWAVRKFRPDVIITRFPTDGRGGHGHHTSSAILAAEAFEKAGDPNAFPWQLNHVSTWSPKRLLLNTGRWWNKEIKEGDDGVTTVDVGAYNTLLGQSYTEIAAKSRSQHKSQGFGSTGVRGGRLEFLEHIKGEQAQNGLFDNVNTGWSRVKGGLKVQGLLDDVLKSFDSRKPSAIVDRLLKLRAQIQSLEDDYWKKVKLAEIDNIVVQAMGLYAEVVANDYIVTPGEMVEFNVEMINRSAVKAVIKRVGLQSLQLDTVLSHALVENEKLNFKLSRTLPKDMPYTQPYWLKDEGTLGMYSVKDRMLVGTPENEPALTLKSTFEISGQEVNLDLPLIYKWNDPVAGESYRPFEVSPTVTLNIKEKAYIFASNQPQSVEVKVKGWKAGIQGDVQLRLPSGWSSQPTTVPFTFTKKGEELWATFQVTPSQGEYKGNMKAVAQVSGQQFSKSLVSITYDHIPTQTLFPEAKAEIVKLDIKKYGDRVGYIQGAGDDIPASLRNIGFEVLELGDEEITAEILKSLDAVILGVRALNTRDVLKFKMQELLSYVNEGGTLMVQYNTSFRLKTNDFSPFPLKLSRDRVSVEDAEVRVLKPGHAVMNEPNKITKADFAGWVQERGLYFPNEWDGNFDAILSSNDPGEKPKDGGLLIAKYGKGHYIYTGYSWFRELPAGVPGAYRIFANLVSLGNAPDQATPENKKTGGKKGKKKRVKKEIY